MGVWNQAQMYFGKLCLKGTQSTCHLLSCVVIWTSDWLQYIIKKVSTFRHKSSCPVFSEFPPGAKNLSFRYRNLGVLWSLERVTYLGYTWGGCGFYSVKVRNRPLLQSGKLCRALV